jgi:Fe-S oxidoreductase
MPKSDGLPFPLAGLTRFRNLPAPTDSPLSERIPEVTEAKGKKRGTTAFYPGCVVEYVYPEIGEAVVSALSRFGWEVHLQKGQGCCGIPALLKGDAETARSLARHNCGMSALQDADYVITACPTCLKALREDFVRLLPDEKVASRLADKAHDFSEFLINVAKVKAKDFSHQASKQKVTYHDPCHARHGLGISDEPRKLLELAGYTIAEMANSDACCGFAGSYSLSYPEISESILKRKMEAIESAEASILATDCPGCLIQLRGALGKSDLQIRALHTAEIIAMMRV